MRARRIAVAAMGLNACAAPWSARRLPEEAQAAGGKRGFACQGHSRCERWFEHFTVIPVALQSLQPRLPVLPVPKQRAHRTETSTVPHLGHGSPDFLESCIALSFDRLPPS